MRLPSNVATVSFRVPNVIVAAALACVAGLGIASAVGATTPGTVPATVPATVPVSSVTSPAGPIPPGITATPAELAGIRQRVKAENNLCAVAGTYFTAALSTGTPDEQVDRNRVFVIQAPVFSALANDLLVNPVAAASPTYGPVAEAWARLFGGVIDQLGAAGVPDADLQAIVAGAADLKVDQLPASVDAAAFERAAATVTTDLVSAFEAIVEDADDDSIEALCPSIVELINNIDSTDPALLTRITNAPNSFCAGTQLLATGSFAGTLGDDSPEAFDRAMAAFVPGILATYQDTLANPPEGLPPSFVPVIQAIVPILERAVAELKAAGLTDADLKSLMVSATSEEPSSTMPSATRSAYERALTVLDLKADIDKAGSLSDESAAGSLVEFCPNMAEFVGGES